MHLAHGGRERRTDHVAAHLADDIDQLLVDDLHRDGIYRRTGRTLLSLHQVHAAVVPPYFYLAATSSTGSGAP